MVAQWRPFLVALAWAALVLITPPAGPVLAQSPAQTPTPLSTPRKKAREGQSSDYKRQFEDLLKHPDQVGFHPTQQHFRQVLDLIRRIYVEPVAEQSLTESIQATLKEFLTQAKVEPESLSLLEGVDLEHVFGRVQELYGRKVDPVVLGYVTLIGLIDGTHDPHTYLMTPKDTAEMRRQLRPSSFGGIGIFIEMDNASKVLKVMETLDDTPAAKAGLQPGDLILKIDGYSTEGDQQMEALQNRIRGPIGTVVTLTLRRSDKTFDVFIRRAEIKSPILKSKIYPGDIGYIRLYTFWAADGASLMREAEEKLKAGSIKGLILDLRNNGGGLVDVAVGIVGHFVPNNSLVTYIVNRKGERQDYRTQGQGGLGLPVILMINENSASASEITAGALRDLHVATLVGDHSFGKGSVQMFEPIQGSGREVPAMVHMTFAHFYTPTGQVINREGIEPDLTIDMEPQFVGKEGLDTQLSQALEVLRKQIAAGHR